MYRRNKLKEKTQPRTTPPSLNLRCFKNYHQEPWLWCLLLELDSILWPNRRAAAGCNGPGLRGFVPFWVNKQSNLWGVSWFVGPIVLILTAIILYLRLVIDTKYSNLQYVQWDGVYLSTSLRVSNFTSSKKIRVAKKCINKADWSYFAKDRIIRSFSPLYRTNMNKMNSLEEIWGRF